MAGKQTAIKERAIAQAIAFLRTAGCTYLIQDEDGNEVANTIPAPARGKYQKTGIHYKPHFKPYIDALNGEGMVDIVIPEEFGDPVRYRGALAGYLHSEFGSGGYITSLNLETRTVSVIVVGGDLPKSEHEGVDIDAAHSKADELVVAMDEPKPKQAEHGQFRRAPAPPLNPVLPADIVEALRVPDFGKPD